MDYFSIDSISFFTPEHRRPVSEMVSQGELSAQDGAAMEENGFGFCLKSESSAYELARIAAAGVLERSATRAIDIDLLVNAPALRENGLVKRESSSILNAFMYCSPRLQYDLGLVNARVIGIGEMGCISLLSAVDAAVAHLTHNNTDLALCVSADSFCDQPSRNVLNSIISDSSCAVIVRRNGDGHKILAYEQITKGYYWDADEKYQELLASYYPTGRRAILNLLARAKLTMSDLKVIIPTNVSKKSWEIMGNIIGAREDQIYLDNIHRYGHSVATDCYINLATLVSEGTLASGDIVLLYGFGLGAHWGAMLLQISGRTS